MIDRPGIYPDMSSEDYFADPAPAPSLTQSIAKLLIARSPLHAKCAHPRLRDPVDDEDEPIEKYDRAKAIGSAAHSLMLGRGKDVAIGHFDSWRKDEAKTFRAEAEAAGKMPILIDHHEVAVRMVAAGQEQLAAAGFEDAFAVDRGNSEVCVMWEEDGIWFRTLIDWLPHDHFISWDYKTSEMSCAPHSIGRMMAELGWDLQAAMHERGLLATATSGVATHRAFRFVAQEQAEPFALIVCELPDDVMEMGRRKLDYAVRLWRRSMLTGKWPAYPPELYQPQYPPWAEQAWLNREIHEAALERQGNGRNPVNHLLAG